MFVVSDSRGDVSPGSIGGLVHEDTRFVSRWELRLDGRPLSLLKSGLVDYDSAAFFLAALHAFGAEWEVEAVGAEGDVRRAEGEPA